MGCGAATTVREDPQCVACMDLLRAKPDLNLYKGDPIALKNAAT